MPIRLDEERKRVAPVFADGDFRNACGEYEELKTRIGDYVTPGKSPARWQLFAGPISDLRSPFCR